MESGQRQHLFLASFKCIRIPKALFARTAQHTYQWGNSGELERVSEDHYSQSLYLLLFGEGNDVGKFMQDIEADGIASLHGKSWSEWFIVQEPWRKRTLKYSSPDDAKRSQFTILGLVISVFPDVWSEIAWEEVEAQLWEVVETTCVPFLSVLTTDDIVDYLDYSSSQQKRQKQQYLISLLKFLIRLSLILGEKTPANFRFLICEGIWLLRTSELEALEDVSYLELLQSTVYILSTNNNQPWAARKDLMELNTNISKRSHAAIGFVLASLPSSWETSRAGIQWFPSEAPSTMEIIAYALLAGASSIADVFAQSLQNLSLKSRVLIAFCEAKRKSFSPAYLLLRESFTELTNSYGKSSMEYLLAGTALVSCCNEGFGGNAAEIIANSLFTNLYGPDGVPVKVEFPQQTFPMMALADCLLGQSKFDEARKILLRILEYPLVDFNLSNTVICTELRLLKMSRRQRKAPSDSEDWERLGHVFSHFDMATDSIKYECLEELVSFLSVLKPRDKPPQIFEIVQVVNNYHVEEYNGSADSNQNLASNMESLQQYKNELNLFTILGPQLHYCRKMRDRFPNATVDFIERIGAANWHRFQRIKGLMEPIDLMEVTVDTAASKFQDSGLGSSLGSELSGNQILDMPQYARSVVSIRSFMEIEQGAATLQSMPPKDSAGNRICYICQKTLKDVHHESQWKRHAFSDLRPYVCIVEDCKANSLQFASRSEFSAHLTEHQSYKTWRCKKCGTSSQSLNIIQDHVSRSHPPSTSAEQDCQIEELSHLRDLSTLRCPFCNDIPGHANFVGHICHHLEETSLSAIPRAEDEFDGDDGEGMSWEGSSPGGAYKKEMDTITVEEIPKIPEPDARPEPNKDGEAWGFAVPDPRNATEHAFSFWGAPKRNRGVAQGSVASPSQVEDNEVVEEEEPMLEPEKEEETEWMAWGGPTKKRKRSKEDKAKETDISRNQKKDGRKTTPNTRLATYFLPGIGIDREVITTDITRYLGSEALVKPGTYKNEKGEAIQGYYFTAYRSLTMDQITDIKADSAIWQAERKKLQMTQTPSQSTSRNLNIQSPNVTAASEYSQTPHRSPYGSSQDHDYYMKGYSRPRSPVSSYGLEYSNQPNPGPRSPVSSYGRGYSNQPNPRPRSPVSGYGRGYPNQPNPPPPYPPLSYNPSRYSNPVYPAIWPYSNPTSEYPPPYLPNGENNYPENYRNSATRAADKSP